MMLIKFYKDLQVEEITTNNQKDIDYFLKHGYRPLSVKFVPGDHKTLPKSVDERIIVTIEHLINHVKDSRIFGAAKLNAQVTTPDIKIKKRNDPLLLIWYSKFERFHKYLSEDELNEGMFSLVQYKSKQLKGLE